MNEWDMAIRSVRNNARGLVIGTIIGLIIAIAILVLLTPLYKAEMIIAPAQRTGMPNLSSFLPQGTSETPVLQYFVERIDAANASDFTTFQTLINGPQLAAYINAERPDLIPSGRPYQWLSKNIKIRGVGTSPYRRITVRHPDPAKARELLEILFAQTDKIIRRDALSLTTRRIAYLKEGLKKTIHPDHRDAMIALLKEQERSAMTVSIDNHFAAIPIEPPHAIHQPVSPDWRVVLPLCLFAGAIGGLMISGFIRAVRRQA